MFENVIWFIRNSHISLINNWSLDIVFAVLSHSPTKTSMNIYVGTTPVCQLHLGSATHTHWFNKTEREHSARTDQLYGIYSPECCIFYMSTACHTPPTSVRPQQTHIWTHYTHRRAFIPRAGCWRSLTHHCMPAQCDSRLPGRWLPKLS